MKLIDEFDDSHYGAISKIYRFPNGVRLIHTKKSGIRDFVSEIVLMGGSYFEKQVGVPQGTAHFLEHLLMNPNGTLDTIEKQDKFKFGSSRKPEIFCNATTWRKWMSFYTYGHPKGALRMLKFLKYILEYPEERFTEFIQKEKGIILAELERMFKKEHKDSTFAYNKFMFESFDSGFFERIPGTQRSIKSIELNDLLKFKRAIFTAQNVAFCIQSSRELNSGQKKLLTECANLIPKSTNKLKIHKKSPVQKTTYKHFKDEDEQGVFLSMNFIKRYSKSKKYENNVGRYFLGNLLSFVGFNELREKQGLVYGIENFASLPVWDHNTYGIKFTFEKTNFEKLLEELYTFITKDMIEFLNTKQGERWVESQISKLIFKTTKNYDGDYTQHLAFDLVPAIVDYKYDEAIAAEYAKKLTSKDIISILKKDFITQPVKFWFVSPYEDKEIYSVFRKSKIYKHFKAKS